MMTLISWVNRIYGSQGLATLACKCQPNLKIIKNWVVESSAKCLEILYSYLEKSGNYILPNLWEP